MDAFASVISNNLNILMKTLTVITFLISIPTLIASFFGMNTGVPWEGKIAGFWIVVAISFMICMTISYFMFRKKK
jgi:magnesium transporter